MSGEWREIIAALFAGLISLALRDWQAAGAA